MSGGQTTAPGATPEPGSTPTPPAVTLELGDVADEALRQAIVTPLVAFNTAMAGPGQGRPLVIAVRDAQGAVIGGLWGSTGYRWLFTQLLVVPEACRGTGLGRRLMGLAEDEARARGCHGAWLDTFEFQARGFYERLGYTCFGELADYPPGYRRWFMKKSLTGAGVGPGDTEPPATA